MVTSAHSSHAELKIPLSQSFEKSLRRLIRSAMTQVASFFPIEETTFERNLIALPGYKIQVSNISLFRS
jgi:hypothetical protein